MDEPRLEDTERLRGKKILLVSEFADDDYAYTYASSFARSMWKLGCEVKRFNCKQSFLPYMKGPSQLFCRGVKQVNDVLMNRDLKREFLRCNPDIVFLLKADNVSFRTLRWMSRHSDCKIMNFYPDNPFVFWNGNSNANVLRSLPLYDRFAIWSHMLVQPLESAGCKQVEYFPFGYDDEKFFSGVEIAGSEREKLACDVSFVGTWDCDREKDLCNLVKTVPNINLSIWGGMWRQRVSPKSALYPFVRGGALSADEMVRVFHCSKIVLNFLRRQNMTSHNMRTFEATACGAFLLTERSYEQAELLFCEGESVACFVGIDELANKVSYYLANEAERVSIARKGYTVAQQYSLDRFIAKMLLGRCVWSCDSLASKDIKANKLQLG